MGAGFIIVMGILIALFLSGVIYVELRVRRGEREQRARRENAGLPEHQSRSDA
jgi:uncharacterized membrane protein YciS (DUF1049 family)